MSGKTLRFILDGETYEVPEDQAEAVRSDLATSGLDVKFLDDTPATPGAPPSSSHAVEFAPPPKPEDDGGDWIDALANPNWEAAGAGLLHGATMGGARKAGDLIASGLRAVGADDLASSAEGASRAYRDWDDKNRDSGWYTAGDVGGSLALNLATPGAGAVAGIAKAGIEGGLRAFDDSTSDNAAGEGVFAGLRDAGIAGALHVPTSLAGSALRGMRDKLPEWALINRVSASGPYGSDMKRMAQNKGGDYLPKLGAAIEERGLHLRNPDKSRWSPSNWFPAGSDTYLTNARRLEADSLNAMKQAEDRIATLPQDVMVDTGGVVSNLRKEASKLRQGSWDPDVKGESAFRDEMADMIAQRSRLVPSAQPNAVIGPNGTVQSVHPNNMPPPGYEIPFNDALFARRDLDRRINWERLGGADKSPMKESVRREVAGNTRAELGNALDRGVASGTVSPTLADKWKTGRDDYAVAAAVRDPAIARVFQEYGNQVLSLPSATNLGAGVLSGNPVGAVAAAGAGQILKHFGHGLLSDVQHVGAGIGKAADAVANKTGPLGYALKNTPRLYSPMAAHNMDREAPGSEDAAISALAAEANPEPAQPLDPLPPAAPPVAPPQPMAPPTPAEPQLPRGPQPNPPPSYIPEPEADPVSDASSLHERTQGQNLGTRLAELLDQNPAPLVHYLDQFEQAETIDDLEAIAERLARTDKGFAKNIYPKLIGSR